MISGVVAISRVLFLSPRSDSGEERRSWKKKKSKSRDQHHKSQKKHGSRSRDRPSSSDSEGEREKRRGRSRDRRRKRSSSRSSVSSVTSPSPSRSQSSREDLGQQLSVKERLRLKDEKKQQAALMKALETPEEKRARRLAKKEAKERKKREKMGWGEEYMGYTNTDNPFGDNNLLGTFIWSKVSSYFRLNQLWGAREMGLPPHCQIIGSQLLPRQSSAESFCALFHALVLTAEK